MKNIEALYGKFLYICIYINKYSVVCIKIYYVYMYMFFIRVLKN